MFKPYNQDQIMLLPPSLTECLPDDHLCNIRTRYPDYRLKFYKLCTASYIEDYLKKIKKVFNKLCREIKLKK